MVYVNMYRTWKWAQMLPSFTADRILKAFMFEMESCE